MSFQMLPFTTSADYDHDKLKIQCEDEGDKG